MQLHLALCIANNDSTIVLQISTEWNFITNCSKLILLEINKYFGTSDVFNFGTEDLRFFGRAFQDTPPGDLHYYRENPTKHG